jgi:hypothetical protein
LTNFNFKAPILDLSGKALKKPGTNSIIKSSLSCVNFDSRLLSAGTRGARSMPPWFREETEACFIVRDANRQALACVYLRMSWVGALPRT